MELYEAGELVGYVVESPYDYEYSGGSAEVAEYLSEKPEPSEMESNPDAIHEERWYVPTGEEWYLAVGRTLQDLGVWYVEITDG